MLNIIGVFAISITILQYTKQCLIPHTIGLKEEENSWILKKKKPE